MPPPRSPVLAALLGLTAGLLGQAPLRAGPEPVAAPAQESWVGLRVVDPGLRLKAVGDAAGPLNAVADAIPFLVIALDDESPPVRAAVRERLRALADEAVDPLLDALQAVRPGTKAGTFGALSSLGMQVTPVDLAAGAGAMTPVNPPDRREVALFLALPAGMPSVAEDPERLWASLRLASILLTDADAQVRRAAAAALGLLGLEAVRAAGPAEGAEPRSRPLRLVKGQQERLVELLHHGSTEIAAGAAGLAARFGDGAEPIVSALAHLLERPAVRDAAALALADLGPAAAPALPALGKERSYGCWRALLRLGSGDRVLAALASKERGERRLAAKVCLAEGQGGERAAEALLPELENALEDGSAAKIEPHLSDLVRWGARARSALVPLAAFVARDDAEPRARDLAAAAALAIDPTTPWARARLADRLDGAVREASPAVATGLAALLDHDLVSQESVPLAILGPGSALYVGTLAHRPLGAHAAAYVARHGPAAHLHARALVTALDVSPEERAAAWAVPTLGDYARLGWLVDAGFDVLRSTLDALRAFPAAPPDLRALPDHLLGAPDPWLRHLAARALRRMG